MKRIGKYEVIAPLGKGGSGSVFRAYDPLVDRQVAIKRLADPLDSNSLDPKELARLRSEARAAGRLRHRNVVNIFDLVGVEEGHPYLVMELLEGQDLSDSLPAGAQMEIRQAVEIMHQAAQGLQHAHSNGVVHRDVSPSNIRLLPDGTVKIIDFGIAGGFQGSRTMTDTDTQLGTVLYFSPEHLTDPPMELDPRSDIFSYGTVFYQILAGKHPFAGQDDQETVCNILLHEPETLTILRPDCPALLAQIIHRALLKDLDLRYPSLQDLLTDLDTVLMELRRPETDELFRTAREAADGNHVELAKAALSRILNLVPDRKDARELLDSLNSRQRESTVRGKVQACLIEAEQKAKIRRFRETVSILERAQRLDPASSEVSKRLSEARSAQERHERGVDLTRQAEEHLQRGQLAEALTAAEGAVRLDPDDAEASRLAVTIRSEVEANRQKRVSEGVAHARQLLKEEQFVTAEAVLSALLEQFPDEPSVQLLHSYARSESLVRNRKRVVENAHNEAIRRAAFGEYDLALAAVDQALEQYRDDPDLLRLRAATQAGINGREKKAGPPQAGESTRRMCACGNVLKAGAKFCDRCGKQTVSLPTTNTSLG